jgi:heme exporter protein B
MEDPSELPRSPSPPSPDSRRAPPAPAPSAAQSGVKRLVRGTATILLKDLRIELATGEILTTTAFFAVLVAVLAALSFTTGAEATTRVAPGALWLAILFASILALGRTWQREREESAFTGLLASPIPRAAIWGGKAIGVLAFLLAVELILVPIVALLFHVDLPLVMGPLAVVMAFGTLGVAAAGTLFGAMTVRTRARELLLSVVVFPLLSPALMASVGATRELLYAAAAGQPGDLGEVGDYLRILAVFDATVIVGALTMFGALLDD